MATDDQSINETVASPSSVESHQITLQVGERRFLTTRQTLTEGSGFFSSLLSGRWDNAQSDGFYFVDADPELFEYILRYLRRGIFPIFYDKLRGHDHAKYLALLEEARYFQIDPLEAWLKEKKYLQAIKIRYSAEELDGVLNISETTETDIEIEHKTAWVTVKVYVCPRKIPVHRGNPQACGILCRKLQGDGPDDFEDEVVFKTMAIRKRTLFDQNICFESR